MSDGSDPESADGRTRRSRATRTALVLAARDLFVERGFAGVSTGDISAAAGTTRNALYYHFESKEAVFRAVYEHVEGELARHVIPTALAEPTALRRLEVGCELFLEGCLDPAVLRISVLEAPSALGFRVMREIDDAHYLDALRSTIAQAMADGELPRLPVDALASMLIGALDEAALLIATADDSRRAREDATRVARALIGGLTAVRDAPPA